MYYTSDVDSVQSPTAAHLPSSSQSINLEPMTSSRTVVNEQPAPDAAMTVDPEAAKAAGNKNPFRFRGGCGFGEGMDCCGCDEGCGFGC
ncbi:hypothetical protein FRB99_007830 [Tulasnella sp. 403]|nr:hypothetical protein FRB99_007830 [Tulasnella sp. 403]